LSRIIAGSNARKTAWPQIFLGVALTSAGTLLLELSLTRIFSVVFYYHFAFLAISIALFGLGVGGVVSYALPGKGEGLYRRLGVLSAANTAAVIFSLLFVISRKGELGNAALAAIYFAAALPFLFSGITLSLVVGETIRRVDRIYFFDLLGAAAGCLALVPILNTFGGPNTVLASAILFSVAASMWFNLAGSAAGRAAGVIVALGLVLLITVNGKRHWIDIHYAKGQPLPAERFSQWNSFSRVGLAPEKDGSAMSITIDADASTGIPSFDWDHLTDNDKRILLGRGPGFAYVLRPGAKTLVIGSGGGWDIARALASGSKDVTGVEINPIIANTVMRRRFPDLSRRLYFRPEVHIVVEDGRSFVRQTGQKYQILQATLVDTWAATAAGAFALSENNLYTTEAFRDYLERLTSDGLLAFTRWGFDPPRESLRLVTLARKALSGLGETEAWRHIVVLRDDAAEASGWGAQDTVLVFRNPVSNHDLTSIRTALGQRPGLQALYTPGDAASNAFGHFLLDSNPAQFEAGYPFNITPVGDDRPFFFYTVQPRDIWSFLTHAPKAADYKINRALPLLFELVAVSILATLIILAVPPLLLRNRLPAGPGVRRSLLYFLCIGPGYILVEVALIQKFVLFLGHPTYALTVIIFSMLIASGAGSYWSKRIVAGGVGRLRLVLLGISVLVVGVAFAAAMVTSLGAAWALPLKVAATVFLIAPAGFLMGMPFPVGLSRLELRYPHAVRWAWALNAASSVMGSTAAIVLSISFGLRITVLAGAAFYVAALFLAGIGSRDPVPAIPVKPVPVHA
jgi:hypothetical protein